MAPCLVVFASLHQVALLKRALYRRGVFVDMQRTPTCLARTGCGFALRAEPSQLAAISQECAQLTIVPGGTYTVDAAGNWIDFVPASDGL